MAAMQPQADKVCLGSSQVSYDEAVDALGSYGLVRMALPEEVI